MVILAFEPEKIEKFQGWYGDGKTTRECFAKREAMRWENICESTKLYVCIRKLLNSILNWMVLNDLKFENLKTWKYHKRWLLKIRTEISLGNFLVEIPQRFLVLVQNLQFLLRSPVRATIKLIHLKNFCFHLECDGPANWHPGIVWIKVRRSECIFLPKLDWPKAKNCEVQLKSLLIVLLQFYFFLEQESKRVMVLIK